MTTATPTFDAPDRRFEGSPSGEEELRFIRNFHDVFLSIGLGLFAVGLGLVSVLILAEQVTVQSFDEFRAAGWTFAGVAFFNAAVMWALAEFFARNRRLFLPAIVILLAFLAYFGAGAAISYLMTFAHADHGSVQDALESARFLPLAVTGGMAVATLAYYARTKLPFAMGVFGMMVAGAGIAVLFALSPDALVGNGVAIQLITGLFLFMLGVAFDARDPERRTRFSDNAFWLHFFAAPLIFVSVMSLAGAAGPGGLDEFGLDGAAPASAAVTLGIVVVFAVLSLLINRRALLVSGLVSAAIAIAILVRNAGLSGAWTASVTLLVLGGAMVLLGAGWHAARRVLVAPFPKTGWIARIVPPEPARDGVSE